MGEEGVEIGVGPVTEDPNPPEHCVLLGSRDLRPCTDDHKVFVVKDVLDRRVGYQGILVLQDGHVRNNPVVLEYVVTVGEHDCEVIVDPQPVEGETSYVVLDVESGTDVYFLVPREPKFEKTPVEVQDVDQSLVKLKVCDGECFLLEDGMVNDVDYVRVQALRHFEHLNVCLVAVVVIHVVHLDNSVQMGHVVYEVVVELDVSVLQAAVSYENVRSLGSFPHLHCQEVHEVELVRCEQIVPEVGTVNDSITGVMSVHLLHVETLGGHDVLHSDVLLDGHPAFLVIHPDIQDRHIVAGLDAQKSTIAQDLGVSEIQAVREGLVVHGMRR